LIRTALRHRRSARGASHSEGKCAGVGGSGTTVETDTGREVERRGCSGGTEEAAEAAEERRRRFAGEGDGEADDGGEDEGAGHAEESGGGGGGDDDDGGGMGVTVGGAGMSSMLSRLRCSSVCSSRISCRRRAEGLSSASHGGGIGVEGGVDVGTEEREASSPPVRHAAAAAAMAAMADTARGCVRTTGGTSEEEDCSTARGGGL